MSATGGPDDVFPTPAWCVHRLLEAWQPRPGRIFEPGVGDGAIVRATQQKIGVRPWFGVDCRATCARALEAIPGGGFEIADFTRWQLPDPRMAGDVAAVIANNPFSLNEEFIRRCRLLFPGADGAFLVQLGFLASKRRVALWRDVGMPDVHVLPDRPGFTADGQTDMRDYAWIVLPAEARARGSFGVLALTPPEERGKRPRGRRPGAAP